ncbi:hypothetical protein ACQ4LE_010798 [Meloidogyne hapla]
MLFILFLLIFYLIIPINVKGTGNLQNDENSVENDFWKELINQQNLQQVMQYVGNINKINQNQNNLLNNNHSETSNNNLVISNQNNLNSDNSKQIIEKNKKKKIQTKEMKTKIWNKIVNELKNKNITNFEVLEKGILCKICKNYGNLMVSLLKPNIIAHNRSKQHFKNLLKIMRMEFVKEKICKNDEEFWNNIVKRLGSEGEHFKAEKEGILCKLCNNTKLLKAKNKSQLKRHNNSIKHMSNLEDPSSQLNKLKENWNKIVKELNNKNITNFEVLENGILCKTCNNYKKLFTSAFKYNYSNHLKSKYHKYNLKMKENNNKLIMNEQLQNNQYLIQQPFQNIIGQPSFDNSENVENSVELAPLPESLTGNFPIDDYESTPLNNHNYISYDNQMERAIQNSLENNYSMPQNYGPIIKDPKQNNNLSNNNSSYNEKGKQKICNLFN